MIDTVLNLLFRCPHRRLSRPVTPTGGKKGEPHIAYVVCLDCGKRFAYDTRQMHIGKALDEPPPEPSRGPLPSSRSKLRTALWVSVPLGVLVGTFLKHRKPAAQKPAPGDQPPERLPSRDDRAPAQNPSGTAR